MKTILGFLTTLFVLAISLSCQGSGQHKITIIENGGGTDFIENSLITITLGVTGGADYLELPVNSTRDDQLIVFGDITLNRLTDVALVFPERNRDDGNFYVVDFSLQELRQLRLKKVFEDDLSSLSLGIPTLKEALTVIRALNNRYTKNTGVVIQLEHPQFYQGEGKMLSTQLQTTLSLLSFGPENKIFIESSDPDELQKISRWPINSLERKYPLIQKIELQPEAADFFMESGSTIQHSWLLSNSGRRILASYADAVALPDGLLKTANPDIQNFIQSLHSFDIKIFAKMSKDHLVSEEMAEEVTEHKPAPFRTITGLDGIYVDSLQGMPLVKGEVTTTVHPEQSESVSSLPPFFSNLGLTEPKPTSQVHNFREEENAEELE